MKWTGNRIESGISSCLLNVGAYFVPYAICGMRAYERDLMLSGNLNYVCVYGRELSKLGMWPFIYLPEKGVFICLNEEDYRFGYWSKYWMRRLT